MLLRSPIALLRFAATASISATLMVACGSDTPTATVQESHPDVSATLARNDLGSSVLSALAQVRQVTASYHDLETAKAAGYAVWSPNPFAANATCPSNALGNMGYHLVNLSLRGSAANPAAGDAVIDPMRPEMLLYEKRPDAEMHLVGVEYIVFKAAWERVYGAGAAAPQVFGQPLILGSHPFPGGTGSIPHYELHVWLWTNNPLGMFAPWNPTVSC